MRETIYKHNKKTLFKKKNLFFCIDSFFIYLMYRVVVIYYERLSSVSSYRAAVRRSDSWDVDFYLLVVSDVSTRRRRWRGNQAKSVASYARRVSPVHVTRTNHKSGDIGFWKPLDSWVSDSYLEPKLDLHSVDAISFYSRDRILLYLSSFETYETRTSRQ